MKSFNVVDWQAVARNLASVVPDGPAVLDRQVLAHTTVVQADYELGGTPVSVSPLLPKDVILIRSGALVVPEGQRVGLLDDFGDNLRRVYTEQVELAVVLGTGLPAKGLIHG